MLRIGLLLLTAFWMVRSAGEALYFFLQQFHRPEHEPHNIDLHFRPLRMILGDIATQKGYINMQVFWQVVPMAAITLFTLLVLRWNSIPAWI